MNNSTNPTSNSTPNPTPNHTPDFEQITVHIYDALFEKLISVVDDTDFDPYLTYSVSDGDENLYDIVVKVSAIIVSSSLITMILPNGKGKQIWISTTDYSVLKIM